jgi:hypothetical protein
MKNSDFCNIQDLEFSQTSVTYFRRLEDTIVFGNIVATFNAAATFKTIFSDRGYSKVVKNITTSDWEEFGTSMIGVHLQVKNKADAIFMEALDSNISSKEKAFWRCMYRANR